MILFFDTETTGLPDRKLRLTDTRQPRIVQLAAILVDEKTEEVVEEMNCIAYPEGYIIPDVVAAIHGITTEIALAKGIPIKSIMEKFDSMVNKANRIVGHNIQFDSLMLRIERHKMGNYKELGLPTECTMLMSTNICKLPPTPRMIASGFNTYKSPKLEEAYLHLFRIQLMNAHDALVDVKACMEVYFELKLLERCKNASTNK